MSLDGIALGHELSVLVRDYVRRATEPLVAEIAGLREQLKAIPAAKDGRDGKDAVVDLELVRAEVAKAVAEIPAPKDVDPLVVQELVTRAVDAIPRPKDGVDGKDGKDSITQEMLKSLVEVEIAEIPRPKDADPIVIEQMVKAAVESLPKAQDGKDGTDGKDADVEIIRAEVSKAVALIPHGRDGRDADPSIVEMLVKAAVDAIPKPRDGIDGTNGTNGVDGLSLKNMSGELLEDGQTVVFKFEDEAITREVPIRFPVPVYKDVYSREKSYLQGDSVTQDGGTFIALRDEPGPCPGAGWRCSVKRGRQGDPGKPGNPGKDGNPGTNGKDLTQMGPDGRKW